jgi:hypothetical protein
MESRRENENVEDFPPRLAARPVGGLLSDLARQSGLLLRQEVALVKAEMLGKLTQVGTGVGMLAAGGLVAFAGLLYVLAAAMFGLAMVVDLWLAALIVGMAVLILGGALLWIGRARLQAENLTPRRTIRSLKDDAEWAREQMR